MLRTWLALAAVAEHRDAEAAQLPRQAVGAAPRRLRSASSGRLIVFDTPLSVCFWKAAWWRTCHSKSISCAVLKTSRAASGTPATPLRASRAWRPPAISASEWKPARLASRSKVSLTKVSTRSPSGPFTRCSKASAKIGSMPDEQPAIIEMVPVGAMVVTVELRSGRPSPVDRPAPVRERAALLGQPAPTGRAPSP